VAFRPTYLMIIIIINFTEPTANKSTMEKKTMNTNVLKARKANILADACAENIDTGEDSAYRPTRFPVPETNRTIDV